MNVFRLTAWDDRDRLFSFLLGVHSGIPLCCVWFFIRKVGPLRGPVPGCPPGFEYTPCPRCREKNRPVPVETCAGKWCDRAVDLLQGILHPGRKFLMKRRLIARMAAYGHDPKQAIWHTGFCKIV